MNLETLNLKLEARIGFFRKAIEDYQIHVSETGFGKYCKGRMDEAKCCKDSYESLLKELSDE